LTAGLLSVGVCPAFKTHTPISVLYCSRAICISAIQIVYRTLTHITLIYIAIHYLLSSPI